MAGGTGATKYKLMDKLIAELDTGKPEDTFKSGYMEWGTDTEGDAREYYELVNDCSIKQVGFVELNEFIGVSPDGLVGEDGLIEIKCPKSSTHVKYRREDKMPATYRKQVQGQLWVTERLWCDFVSFDPRSKSPYWFTRVERDDKFIKKIEDGVNIFVDEMKKEIERINQSPF
jgi:predicted phage-related endonuclease